MLCLSLFLFALTICGAREIGEVDLEAYNNIGLVSLSETKPGPESRIIGGSPASIEGFPFAVQILWNTRLNCGGSLVTRRHVISAAHCFVDPRGTPLSRRDFSIRAGSTYLQGGTVVSISNIVIHPNYAHSTVDNDIAVLRLSSSLTLSDSIQRAYIPQPNDALPDNTTVVAIGWGVTSPGSQVVSSVLMQVAVRTVNRALCANNYAAIAGFPITANMLCAGLMDIGGADSCQGDSGGPLTYNGIVIGITSFGATCGHPTLPGVYAEVSRYTLWIDQTVRDLGGGAAGTRSGLAALILPVIFLMLSY